MHHSSHHSSMNGGTSRVLYGIVAGAVALVTAACADLSGPRPSALSSAALGAALSSVPQGYGSLTSSYVGIDAFNAGPTSLWLAGGRDAGMDRGALMGGGLADAFAGGVGPGHGFAHHGPFGGPGLACRGGAFDAATGRVVCPTITLRNGLTVTSSASFADAAGKVQQAFDTVLTNTVNVQTAVTGTLTFAPESGRGPDGDHRGPGGGHHGWGEGRGPHGMLLGDTARILTATTKVTSSSNRTTSGLAKGSTQRTVNEVSGGTEQTTGTSSRGAFTAGRTVADTTRGLVVPVPTTGPTYPSAGTVIRTMQATIAYTGQTPATLGRREVVTYDGSATAEVVITENGTTKNCTLPLPHGRLSCQ